MANGSGHLGWPLRIVPNLMWRAVRALDHVYRHRGYRSPVDRISFEMAQLYWYCDSSLARRELGFSPRDPAETLDDTIRDVRGSLHYQS